MLGGGPGGQTREGSREMGQGEGEAKRVREEFQALNPFWFNFPQVTQLPGSDRCCD